MKLAVLSTIPGLAISEPLASFTQTRTVPVVESDPLKAVSAGRLKVIWYVALVTVNVSVVAAWAVSRRNDVASSSVNVVNIRVLFLFMSFTCGVG